MHFNAVLVFVHFHVHPRELVGPLELGVDLSINFEIVERRLVLVGDRKCAAAEPHMMGWPQNENPLPDTSESIIYLKKERVRLYSHNGRTDLAISESSTLPAVRISCVSVDEWERNHVKLR